MEAKSNSTAARRKPQLYRPHARSETIPWG